MPAASKEAPGGDPGDPGEDGVGRTGEGGTVFLGEEARTTCEVENARRQERPKSTRAS